MMLTAMDETIGVTVRCTSCRNRIGIDGARKTADGTVCCTRCFENRVEIETPEGVVELIGVF